RLVRRQASLRRPGEPLYLRFRGNAAKRRDYVQHQTGESVGDQVLLGFVKPEMERKDCLGRPADLRPNQCGRNLFLQASRSVAGVSPAATFRGGCGYRAFQRAVVGLAQRGQIRVRNRRAESRYGDDPGTAAESISAGITERRIV